MDERVSKIIKRTLGYGVVLLAVGVGSIKIGVEFNRLQLLQKYVAEMEAKGCTPSEFLRFAWRFNNYATTDRNGNTSISQVPVGIGESNYVEFRCADGSTAQLIDDQGIFYQNVDPNSWFYTWPTQADIRLSPELISKNP